MVLPLAFLLILQAPAPEGVWSGTIDTGQVKLRLVMRVARAGDGTLGAKLDSIDQGAYGIPVDLVTGSADGLRIELKKLGATFEGKYANEGKSLAGEFSQGGGSVPMTFTRTTEEALAQSAPKPGRPMTAEERAFLITNLERTEKLLVEATTGLSEAQTSFKEAPERWSILECAEHIAAIEDFLFGYIRGSIMKIPPKADAPVRTPEELKAADEKVLAATVDRSKKAQAPEPAKPTGRYPDVAAAVTDLKARRSKVIDYVRTTQDDMRSHVMNSMDAYQYMLLLAAHTERHVGQINQVKAAAGYPK